MLDAWGGGLKKRVRHTTSLGGSAIESRYFTALVIDAGQTLNRPVLINVVGFNITSCPCLPTGTKQISLFIKYHIV